MKKFKLIVVTMTSLLVSFASCTLDYVNPNSPTDAETLSTRDGLISVSVGLRQYYSTSGLDALYLTPGTTTREVKGITTFTNIIELEAGGETLPNFNGNITSLWTRMYRVIETADQVIVSVPTVLNTADNIMSTALIAHAKLFKALAYAGLASGFEQAPLATQLDGQATFSSREQLLSEAIILLNEASTSLVANPNNSEVATRVLGADFDLANSVNAIRARVNLIAGNYQAAIDAANLVDLTKKSEFKYSAVSPNPIYQNAVVSANFRPRAGFGLPASLFEVNDNRLNFYLTTPDATVGGEALKTIRGFFDAQTKSIPIYIPDEMRLIRAEAELRINGATGIAAAVVEVDAVRTQSSGDPFSIYANLPVYSGPLTVNDVLIEIYKQRCAELFLTGLRLEDSRRFGRPDPTVSLVERNRNFYPYPQIERNNNTNIPADPEI
jgi:starch-binding outer membrane protein, SusD/RagB family